LLFYVDLENENIIGKTEEGLEGGNVEEDV
jgi:hypothetical protein